MVCQTLITITNLAADIPTQKQLGHAENETPTPFSPLALSLIMVKFLRDTTITEQILSGEMWETKTRK